MSLNTYKVLNEITINKQALTNNYRYFVSENPQAKVAVVAKANAYGHGLEEIARFLDTNIHPPFICVDSLYEAYELLKLGIKNQILIMGYTNPENYAVWKKLPFSFSVFDKETLIALNKHQPGAKIHIKLDTGMCRLGLQPEELPELIKTLKTCNNLVVEGVFSHFSQADNPSKITFTKRQIARFKMMAGELEAEGFEFKWKHIAASSGSSFLRDPYFNLIRLGLGFYGYTPFGPHTKEGRHGRKNLKPALKLTTHIAQIKNVSLGSEVGYSGTYRTKQKEVLAIIPLGYNEGLTRRLSNKGSVTLVDNSVCQIVGNISMDMTTLRLPRGSKAKVGDEVVVISDIPSDLNSLSHHCQIIKDLEYSLLTGLHPSIRRRLV
ncbi:alanine racemase [Candidatus Woesebacteria bacterium]|nr:alanine racemase [Candidatus Woesebacteria bacterium]